MTNEKRLDLIDRNALLKKMQNWNTKERLINCVEYATTVDAVEVVHGRWIDDGGLDEDGNGQYRCSRCGVGEKHNPTVPVSYCWNCGAKMDGDGNG